MILGGDTFAPLHEAGIQLWNAAIIAGEFDDGELDLRSGKCVSRVALSNCIIDGGLQLQDATLDVLVLSGSCVGKFRANGASISGAMWLDGYFISESEVDLSGIEIGGLLDCSYGYFEKGIAAPGADIGGSLLASGAVLTASDPKYAALNFSRAKIKGDAVFSGARMTAAAGSENKDPKALDAQNIKVDGSVTFGGGFTANGEVCFNGAEISKALDFSGGKFHNKARFAIRAERAKVAGAFKFNPVFEGQHRHPFESCGCVSLKASQCGELNCDGGRFNNVFPGDDRPRMAALDCGSMSIAGSVTMCNVGAEQFHSSGTVSLYTSQIGQHLNCGGGWFDTPGDDPKFDEFAMNCQAIKVDGCVFLSVAKDKNVPDKKLDDFAFKADGKVDFQGANVGLQMNCQSGRFNNMFADRDKTKSDDAAIALTLAAARIGDTLFLGKEGPDDKPATIKGSLDLTGATVRVLVDDGLVDESDPGITEVASEALLNAAIRRAKQGNNRPRHNESAATPNTALTKDDNENDGCVSVDQPGLWKTVPCKDGNGNVKELKCNLSLDLFTYDRMKGEDACDAGKRKNWLRRQPPKHLQSEFKSQPFEQLIMVMRAMGYDDEADDIALFKRQTKRQTTPLIDIPEVDGRFPSQAAVVVAAAWLAIFGDKLIWAFIILFYLFRKLLAKLGEILLLDWFVGYGYNMARAVFLLLFLVFVFGAFYNTSFGQGAIVPADKDVRKDLSSCSIWSHHACQGIDNEAIPLFNPWLYSAEVMVPIVTFGQKAAWVPAPDVSLNLPLLGRLEAPSNLVYDVQLVETVLGWVEGFLLVSFVTGLIAKE